MEEELRSVSLCLLDDVNMSGVLNLDAFEIRYYKPAELQAVLLEAGMGSLPAETSDEVKAYGEFPWARLERPIPANKAKTARDRHLSQLDLSWNHAGARSWWPFGELLRTLNLLKPAGGPVIGRQFYYWLEPLPKPDRRVDRVIYGKPLWDYNDSQGKNIHPLVLEYDLGPSDTGSFSLLRDQLTQCLAVQGKPDNSHLRTAIHYFENGDRKIVPHPLTESFDAIEPLMSYEAALEALLVLEQDYKVEDKLSERVARLAKKLNGMTNDKTDAIRLPFTNFIQRSSEGAASCRKWALRAWQKNSKTRRLCWRQVAITVQTRSHQRCPRLPRVPCVM